ncbi:MAG: PQQ-dependent sugar dehydrogenase [Gammaproteobacteria bacterium]|nr:PQQ-dependent sugar dehydrogenase [Gammaproteobacteria bacterium]
MSFARVFPPLFFFCLFLCLSFSLSLNAHSTAVINDNEESAYELELLISGLQIPWGMAFLSSGEMIFTQRNGQIGIIHLKSRKINWLKNLPAIYHKGQAGLLDVAVSPDYKKTGWIYFTYSKKLGGQSATTLARARLQNNSLQDWQDLLVSQSIESTSHHYGSRIAFDNKGHVFFSIGDRGKRPNAQNLKNHAGSVLRLNLDGSIPKDNPFIGQTDALPEIWSYGHRNPQGLVYDSINDRLWLIEHGPRGGDEINLVLAGKNYGWPVISYGKEYWGPVSVGESTHKKGMEQPVKVYIPSIAPGSLMLYSGRAFAKWQGNLFSGALKLTHLNRIVISSEAEAIAEQRLLETLGERIRCVVESPEGWIYLSTDSGKILRLKPEKEDPLINSGI